MVVVFLERLHSGEGIFLSVLEFGLLVDHIAAAATPHEIHFIIIILATPNLLI